MNIFHFYLHKGLDGWRSTHVSPFGTNKVSSVDFYFHIVGICGATDRKELQGHRAHARVRGPL